jgi:hypothetical protein
VTIERREIHRSSNEDRWYVARDSDSGRVYVQHQANARSGGHIEDIELGAFLTGAPDVPERLALFRLIGALVEQRMGESETIPTEELNSSNDE